jgi:hypothetical protein
MILVLSLTVGVMLILNASVINNVAPFLAPLHAICLGQVPQKSLFHDWLAAVVCGERISPLAATADLQLLGLFHILIVSGAQLYLLECALTWLNRDRDSQLLVPVALLAYVSVTSLTAPILRALVHTLLRRTSLTYKLFWRPAQITLLSGLMALACAPEFATKISLQLGWVASLAFCAARKRSSLSKSLAVYAALFLPLLAIGVPHPISILCNCLIMPLVVLLLFPLSFATVLVHPLVGLNDFTWSLFLNGLRFISDDLSPPDWHASLSVMMGWAYLACLQIFMLTRERDVCDI